MEQRNRKPSTTIASIETEYVRSQRKKEVWRNKQKKRLRQKLFLYAVIALLTFGGLTKVYLGQKQALRDKEMEKEQMAAQLEEVEEQQYVLKQQLLKLDDEEYIGKLARKDYFLSDKHEIIFSIPDKKKTDEKDDGKE